MAAKKAESKAIGDRSKLISNEAAFAALMAEAEQTSKQAASEGVSVLLSK
jgi:hypothetical protein